jgi:flagellin
MSLRVGGSSMLLGAGYGLRRALARAQRDAADSLEKLATGKRINRASDDPSGLVAAENLKVQRTVLDRTIRGWERESTFLGAKDGALSGLGELLIDLEGIVVSAANTGGLSEAERDALAGEADGLLLAIDHVSRVSVFNGQDLLRGYSTADLGSEAGRLSELRDALRSGEFEKAQSIAEGARERVVGERGRIGGRLRGLEAERNAAMETFENVSGAISLIEDTDVAAEVSSLVRSQILEEASVQVMLIERDRAEGALKLLGGAMEFGASR